MAPTAAPTPNIAPLIAAAAIIAGVIATALRLPGVLVMLIGLTVAAWMSTPPPLTGKKDAAGYPSVGNPSEQKALQRHRTWSSLKWKLFVPSADWLPGDAQAFAREQQRLRQQNTPPWKLVLAGLRSLLVPSTFVTVAAIGAALAVVTFPVDALDAWALLPGAGLWLMWPNAAATYVLVKQVDAAGRRFAAPEDPRPAITVEDLTRVSAERERPLFMLVAGAAGIAAITVTAVLVVLTAFDITWLVTPAPLAAAGAAIAAAGVFLHAQALPEALTPWEQTVAARAEWDVRWQTLKVDPAPFLVAHTRYGKPDQQPVIAETFEAPATLGAIGALGLLPKITPSLGPGMRATILNEPDTDGQGQPIPGSKHPLRFTVVAWPVDTSVDVTAPDADQETLRLLLRTATATAAISAGWPQPMLLDMQPVFEQQSPHADDEEELDDDDSDNGAAVSPASLAAYTSTWGAPEYDAGGQLPSLTGTVAGIIGAEAIADPSAGAVMYVGALTTGQTEFTDHTLEERFDMLAREMAWRERWTNALRMNEQKPYFQGAVYKKGQLAGGTTIECQPFMTPQGIQSEAYINADNERKLQSTLNNAPFVSIIGWPMNGDRPGERHPGAFRVLWSDSPIPANPAQIVPASGGPSMESTKWALAAAVNAGFDAAKLPRAELVSATALTARQSRTHIWDLTLRLYGGVTLLAVKSAAEKIRQGMGAAEWLRITGHPEGVRIVVGASPSARDIQYARPRSREVATALDWEQAFIDSRLASPVDGSAPSLTSAQTLETNEDVESLTFTLPRGLALTDFQEPKALDRMRANASKVFIDVRAGDTPDTFRMLTCDTDPMPVPAPFQWDVMGAHGGAVREVSFGTSVEGAPVTWNLDLEAHLLILGSNGSGKGISATAMLTDMLMSGWDVYAADPNKGFNDFAYADPWLRMRATTYADTVAIVRKMVALLDERKALNSAHGVSNIKDLPDHVRPPMTCMFLDEFTSLVIPETVVKLGDHATDQDRQEHAETLAINAAKAAIGSGLGRILREGRATGLVMVLMGQKLTADILKYIPGGSTIKSQMSRLAMGKMSFGDMMSAFNDAAAAQGLLGPSVPRGRGIFESTAQAAFTVQTWWAGGSQADHFMAMSERISGVRPPLADDERFDPAPFRPAEVDDQPIFGRIIEDGTDGEEIVDLGVVDLGPIDLGVVGLGLVAGAADAGQPVAASRAVVFVGPGVDSDDPAHIDVDELPAGRPVTGSAAVDAMVAWLNANPGVSSVTWMSPLAFETDDIGITHGEIAQHALVSAGAGRVDLVMPDGANGSRSEASSASWIDIPPPEAAAPAALVTSPAVAQASTSVPIAAPVAPSGDLFDHPTPSTPQVDDLFD